MEVEYAVINGVNEELWRGLRGAAAVAVPYSTPDRCTRLREISRAFTLNINEAGHVQGIDERAGWMGRGAHVQNEARGETSFMKGVEALLAELHPSHIDKGALE